MVSAADRTVVSFGCGSVMGSIVACSVHRYGFTTIERKGVGPLLSWIVQVSPSTISSVNGLSQCPSWPVLPSLYTRTGELKGRL